MGHHKGFEIPQTEKALVRVPFLRSNALLIRICSLFWPMMVNVFVVSHEPNTDSSKAGRQTRRKESRSPFTVSPFLIGLAGLLFCLYLLEGVFCFVCFCWCAPTRSSIVDSWDCYFSFSLLTLLTLLTSILGSPRLVGSLAVLLLRHLVGSYYILEILRELRRF